MSSSTHLSDRVAFVQQSDAMRRLADWANGSASVDTADTSHTHSSHTNRTDSSQHNSSSSEDCRRDGSHTNSVRNTVHDDGNCKASGPSSASSTWDVATILLVGAGGVGCEVLHLLSLSGFRAITVVDMDTVELSNLNRQLLFTDADIGRAKSAVACARVSAQCPGLALTAVVGRIEEQSDAFFRGFDVVILAVDSVEARRWVNRKMAQLARWALRRTHIPADPHTPHTRCPASDQCTTPRCGAARPPTRRQPPLDSSAGAEVVGTAHPDAQDNATGCAVHSRRRPWRNDAAAAAAGHCVATPLRHWVYRIVSAMALLDTAAEGFRGRCRVIDLADNATACVECSRYLYESAEGAVAMCTWQGIARTREHCVLGAYMRAVGRTVPAPGARGACVRAGETPPMRRCRERDTNSVTKWPDAALASGALPPPPVGRLSEPCDDGRAELDEGVVGQRCRRGGLLHVRRLVQLARQRQYACHVGGPAIDARFVRHVISHTVPAVCFPAALVAGQAVWETIKLVTGVAARLRNYTTYNGAVGCGGAGVSMRRDEAHAMAPACRETRWLPPARCTHRDERIDAGDANRDEDGHADTAAEKWHDDDMCSSNEDADDFTCRTINVTGDTANTIPNDPTDIDYTPKKDTDDDEDDKSSIAVDHLMHTNTVSHKSSSTNDDNNNEDDDDRDSQEHSDYDHDNHSHSVNMHTNKELDRNVPDECCPVCAPMPVVLLHSTMTPHDVQAALFPDTHFASVRPSSSSSSSSSVPPIPHTRATSSSCARTVWLEFYTAPPSSSSSSSHRGGASGSVLQELYLSYKRHHPCAQPIVGTTLQDILTCAGFTSVWQDWCDSSEQWLRLRGTDNTARKDNHDDEDEEDAAGSLEPVVLAHGVCRRGRHVRARVLCTRAALPCGVE